MPTQTYDAVGNVATQTRADATTSTLTYDALGRVTADVVTLPAGTATASTFAYDAAGNRTRETVDGVPIAATFNSRDQLVQRGTASYTYDVRGNLQAVTDGGLTTSYTWTATDRLARVTRADGTLVTHQYDADDRRVAQTVAGQRTQYLWDPTTTYGDIVLETDAAGARAPRVRLRALHDPWESRGG